MRLISMIFAFCFLTNLYCQDETENSKPFTIGLNLFESYSQFDGITLNPGVVLKYSDKSLIFSWKVFQSGNSYYDRYLGLQNGGTVPDRLGFSVIYVQNLLSIKSKINLDYVVDFNYSNIKGQYSTTYNDGMLHPAVYSNNQKVLSFLPGYRIGFIMIKNLYLIQSFGIGIGMIKNNDQLKLADREYTIFNMTDKYSDNLEFSLNIKIGFEYTF
jgi:hypothetical protein